MLSSDKNQTWKIDKHDIEHEATKIIHTKYQKQMSNSDSTNGVFISQFIRYARACRNNADFFYIAQDILQIGF